MMEEGYINFIQQPQILLLRICAQSCYNFLFVSSITKLETLFL